MKIMQVAATVLIEVERATIFLVIAMAMGDRNFVATRNVEVTGLRGLSRRLG